MTVHMIATMWLRLLQIRPRAVPPVLMGSNLIFSYRHTRPWLLKLAVSHESWQAVSLS